MTKKRETLVWKNVRVKLGDLKPWKFNPRTIGKDEARRLNESLEVFNQSEVFLIGPELELYDGHQRWKTWLDKHGPDFKVDARQSNRPLTEQERKRLGIFLHRGAQGEWDKDVLKENFGFDELMAWGFDKDELMKFGFDPYENAPEDPGGQMDKADELLKKWKVKTGDLWEIGAHRLLCGDCTKREEVDRVMNGERADMVFTDPPYGVAIGEKNKFLNSFQKAGKNLENIAGDLMGKDELFDMLVSSFTLTREFMKDCCAIYVTAPQGGELGMMMMMMMMSGLPVRHVLNWIKNSPTFSMGRLDYDYQHEPILFSWKKTHKHYGRGQHKTSTWFIDKPRASKEHPTMKPVELVENAVLNSSDESQIIYEPFSGSGTTLVACECRGRKGRAIEIAPKYVAVALERLAGMGLSPKRINK